MNYQVVEYIPHQLVNKHSEIPYATIPQYHRLERMKNDLALERKEREQNEEIHQFKIKNLVVCENYKYRGHHHYLNSLSVYDRREEFKKISHDNFLPELKIIQ